MGGILKKILFWKEKHLDENKKEDDCLSKEKTHYGFCPFQESVTSEKQLIEKCLKWNF